MLSTHWTADCMLWRIFIYFSATSSISHNSWWHVCVCICGGKQPQVCKTSSQFIAKNYEIYRSISSRNTTLFLRCYNVHTTLQHCNVAMFLLDTDFLTVLKNLSQWKSKNFIPGICIFLSKRATESSDSTCGNYWCHQYRNISLVTSQKL